MLVNVNKFKPYKYMEFEFPKKKQHMLIYWEKNAGGVQEANSNTKEDDEGCEIKKPQMKNDEDKEHIIDPTIKIIFIFNLQMSNNCKNTRFGM